MTSMQERAADAGLPVYKLDMEGDVRFGSDPFSVWDEIAAHGPLFYSTAGRGFFVASDYETIKTVLQDPDTWSSLPTTLTYTTEEIEMHMSPINEDPPEHTEYRRALVPLFGPRKVAYLEPKARQLANMLIDQLIDNGHCDFFADFASKLPSMFFLDWLGLGSEDTERMFELATRGNYEFENQEARDAIDHEISSIISALYAERRRDPREDLASELVRLEINGVPLNEAKLVEVGRLVFIAGQETTASNLGYAMYHLATHPSDRQALVEDPALIPTALEEMTRLYFTGGPVGRIAKREGELNGCPIKPGDRVFIAACAADRHVYDDVDIARWPNRHFAFGLGPHRCLGSHVARMEMRVALEEWHRRIPDYRLPADFEPRHHFGGFMQHLLSLPLEFLPGGGAA